MCYGKSYVILSALVCFSGLMSQEVQEEKNDLEAIAFKHCEREDLRRGLYDIVLQVWTDSILAFSLEKNESMFESNLQKNKIKDMNEMIMNQLTYAVGATNNVYRFPEVLFAKDYEYLKIIFSRMEARLSSFFDHAKVQPLGPVWRLLNYKIKKICKKNYGNFTQA